MNTPVTTQKEQQEYSLASAVNAEIFSEDKYDYMKKESILERGISYSGTQLVDSHSIFKEMVDILVSKEVWKYTDDYRDIDATFSFEDNKLYVQENIWGKWGEGYDVWDLKKEVLFTDDFLMYYIPNRSNFTLKELKPRVVFKIVEEQSDYYLVRYTHVYPKDYITLEGFSVLK